MTAQEAASKQIESNSGPVSQEGNDDIDRPKSARLVEGPDRKRLHG
jgi:hypothetical protein